MLEGWEALYLRLLSLSSLLGLFGSFRLYRLFGLSGLFGFSSLFGLFGLARLFGFIGLDCRLLAAYCSLKSRYAYRHGVCYLLLIVY